MHHRAYRGHVHEVNALRGIAIRTVVRLLASLLCNSRGRGGGEGGQSIYKRE